MARSLDEKKRRKILDSAYRYFGELGFNATSVKTIAGAAGVAPGSIYTYFRNKEELFCSAVEDGWNQFAETVEQKMDDVNGFENKFFRFIDFGFTLLKKRYPLLRGMYSNASRKQLFQLTIKRIVDYIDQLIDSASSTETLNLPSKPEERKFFLKIMISGILFTASTAPPSKITAVIEELKEGFKSGFLGSSPLGASA